MDDIIVINDDSRESLHAAEYAFNLACTYNKNIVLANVISSKPAILNAVSRPKTVPAGFEFPDDDSRDNLAGHLDCLKPATGHRPTVRTLDASKFSERELIAYINAQKTWMIIQGAASDSDVGCVSMRMNMQTILNRILCPVLLVPETAPPAPLERLVYLADLRYAQVPVLNFLAKVRAGDESVILAHVCAKGLPELDKAYAGDLFSNGLSRNAVCPNLYFTALREKDFPDVVDAVLHGMQGDLIVCSNHSWHFEQLFGSKLSAQIPAYVPVPVLVFPY